MMGLEKMSRIWSWVKCSTALSSGESRKDAKKRSPLRHSFTTGFVSHLYSLSGFPPPPLNHSGLRVLLWKKHAIVNRYMWCIKKCTSRSFQLWQYLIVLIYPWSHFFFGNICWKCSNIPHHRKDSDLKQQPHPFCLWHYLLINHLLSSKSWWRNVCSAVLTERAVFGSTKPQKYPKWRLCKDRSPRQRIYRRLGRKPRESLGTPGAVKGSGDGHCHRPPQMKHFPHGVPHEISLALVQISLSIIRGWHQLLCLAFQINNICGK